MHSRIVRLRSGQYLTNSYYIFDGNGNAIIIDPGCSFEKSKRTLSNSIPILILLTHGHFDHTYDCDLFVKEYGTKVLISEEEEKHLNDFRYSYPDQILPGYHYKSLYPDGTFKNGDKISFGRDIFTVIHTPGHTEGSCCFYCDNVLFSGDTLFKGSIGRTDFAYGSSSNSIMKSLKKLVDEIPDNTIILPGHGFQSMMSEEKNNNPFFRML